MQKFILIFSSLLLILIFGYIFLQQDKSEVHPFIINSSKISANGGGWTDVVRKARNLSISKKENTADK